MTEIRQGSAMSDSDHAELLVDIIVNNHNYGRFVAAAVDSALAQTHPQVRVIVVDDGSTDNSRKILSRYEERVDLLLKENGGQASALNAGFLRSVGDIAIFLDADDVLRPQAAALVAATFGRDPRIVKVQYRMELIDELGHRTRVVKPAPHLPLPRGDVRRAEMVHPFDLVWLPTSGNAFRTEALRRILPIPEWDFAGCPDWYLVHLTALLGHVASLEDICADYRVHGDNRYEPQGSTLDLAHVRETVVYSNVTRHALDRLADSLGLECPYTRILSVSDVSNRLVSVKLDPDLHPIATDRLWSLVADGVRAALRRSDVAWPMRLMYIGWLVVLAAAPRSAAADLAEFFLFPQRREALNRLLRRFHRGTSEIGGAGANGASLL
jgi:glycosyltransferase involved in cell wall biosynthesis